MSQLQSGIIYMFCLFLMVCNLFSNYNVLTWSLCDLRSPHHCLPVIAAFFRCHWFTYSHLPVSTSTGRKLTDNYWTGEAGITGKRELCLRCDNWSDCPGSTCPCLNSLKSITVISAALSNPPLAYCSQSLAPLRETTMKKLLSKRVVTHFSAMFNSQHCKILSQWRCQMAVRWYGGTIESKSLANISKMIIIFML